MSKHNDDLLPVFRIQPEPILPKPIEPEITLNPKAKKKDVGIIRGFFSTVGGKIAMATLASMLATTIMNSTAVLVFARAACAVIGKLGDPKVSKTINDILHRGDETATKIDAKVGAKADEPSVEHKPTMIEKAKKKAEEAALAPIKKKADEMKAEIGEKAGDVKEGVDNGVAKVSGAIDNATTKLGKGVEATRVGALAGIDAVKKGAGNMASNLPSREDMAKAQAQARANMPSAICPHCNIALNINDRVRQERMCLNCEKPYWPANARALAKSRGFR